MVCFNGFQQGIPLLEIKNTLLYERQASEADLFSGVEPRRGDASNFV
jgi:hypothetical protein